MRDVEFVFDFGSPTSYLGYKHLTKNAKAWGANIIYTPILLGGVFKATGNQPPGAVALKGAYMGKDLPRFAKRYGVPLEFNPHFPVNTLALMRGAASYLGEAAFIPYLDAMFDAMWVHPRKMDDPKICAEALQAAGFDPQDFMRRISDDATKARLREATEKAVERGVFGVPVFFVGDEMFFGQDRLDFVKETLMG